MNDNEIKDRLDEIEFENFIWVVYIIIIFLSWIANGQEAKYFETGDITNKNNYRSLMILIFSILVIIYLTFLNDSYKDIKELNIYDNEQKKELTYLSFLASLLIVISGFIYLYILINDENIDVEIAFN